MNISRSSQVLFMTLMLLTIDEASADSCTFVTQRVQCGPMSCNRTTRQCVPCSTDSDCYEAMMTCDAGKCRLRSLAKAFSLLPVEVSIVPLVTVLVCSIAVVAGIGGGGVLMPLYIFLLKLPMVDGIALSQAAITGQAFVNVVLQMRSYHPAHSDASKKGGTRPLVNYEYLCMVLPPMMIGMVIGEFGSAVSPDWVRVVLILLVLIFVIYRVIRRIATQRKADAKKAGRRRKSKEARATESRRGEDDAPGIVKPSMVNVQDFSDHPTQRNGDAIPSTTTEGGEVTERMASAWYRRYSTHRDSAAHHLDLDHVIAAVNDLHDAPDVQAEEQDDGEDPEKQVPERQAVPDDTQANGAVAKDSSITKAVAAEAAEDSPASSEDDEGLPLLHDREEQQQEQEDESPPSMMPNKSRSVEEFLGTLSRGGSFDGSWSQLPAQFQFSLDQQQQLRFTETFSHHDHPHHGKAQYPFVYVAVVVVIFASNTVTSTIKDPRLHIITCGSAGYYAEVAATCVANAALWGFVRIRLGRLKASIRRHELSRCHVPFRWNAKTTALFPALAMSAGAGISMLGMGAPLLNVILLETEMLPEVAAATGGCATFTITLAATINFVLLRQLRWDYALLVCLSGAVSALVGQFVFVREIRKRQLQYLFVVCLGVILLSSLVTLTTLGIRNIVTVLEHHGSLEPGGLCKGA